MADLTIASAATLTGAGTASGDLFPLVDISASAGSQGSKITRDELRIAMGITGGGTIATGGFTLTVPATGTAALLGTANIFTAAQKVSYDGNANNYISIGATNNQTVTFSQNALGISLSIVGDTTGSGGGASIRMGSACYFTWQSTTRQDSGSPDTGMLRSAAGVLKITNGSTGYGTVDASAFKVSGTAGVSFGPGLPVSITVVNGIITAAS